ncbi:unnamed protein product [Cyprideis torosa]|uniref:carnosine N-methyltransferase n=1 Tax=Cyprideis torosa TaxID=163714 RepID=A0A7R8ZPI1_9CRUS|nr:unnamed protein product [Cyprideis torosa]CAG0888430.1 unnamed protein product [Cyprideis torosa]
MVQIHHSNLSEERVPPHPDRADSRDRETPGNVGGGSGGGSVDNLSMASNASSDRVDSVSAILPPLDEHNESEFLRFASISPPPPDVPDSTQRNDLSESMDMTLPIGELTSDNGVDGEKTTEDIPLDVVKNEDTISEFLHYQKIINTFYQYRTYALRRVTQAVAVISRLPAREQELYQSRLRIHRSVRDSINVNSEFLEKIAAENSELFVNFDVEAMRRQTSEKVINSETTPTEVELDRLLSVLRVMFRDWSSAGSTEREASYRPVLMELETLFPTREYRDSIQVLVPGAGLARLLFEIALLGFTVQGNEFSLLMMFVSNFFLNKCETPNSYQIFPWVHSHVNVMSPSDILTPIMVPDVCPRTIETCSTPKRLNYSMAGGDFLEAYASVDNFYDAVVSVFFLDTARSVVQYLDVIHRILKPGGYFINLGPLLWHYSDIPHDWSVEPSWEEVRDIMERLGFKFIKERLNHPASFTQNPKSLMLTEYKCIFFVAQKQST